MSRKVVALKSNWIDQVVPGQPFSLVKEAAPSPARNMNADRIMTIQEVAQHLRCTPRTIYNLVYEGKLRAVRVGAHLRILSSTLEQYIYG